MLSNAISKRLIFEFKCLSEVLKPQWIWRLYHYRQIYFKRWPCQESTIKMVIIMVMTNLKIFIGIPLIASTKKIKGSTSSIGDCNSSSSLKSSSESSSSESWGRNDFAFEQQIQNENKVGRFNSKWWIKQKKTTNNRSRMNNMKLSTEWVWTREIENTSVSHKYKLEPIRHISEHKSGPASSTRKPVNQMI